jgi:hypothetical protein
MVTETFPSFRDETWLDGQKGGILPPISCVDFKGYANKLFNLQYLSGKEPKFSLQRHGQPSSHLYQPFPIPSFQGL